MTALVALREGALSIDEAVAHVKHGGAGAVCVFMGTVRDHNDGLPVVRLEYEAYASMALAEMNRIASELAAETPGLRLAVLHRTQRVLVKLHGRSRIGNNQVRGKGRNRIRHGATSRKQD